VSDRRPSRIASRLAGRFASVLLGAALCCGLPAGVLTVQAASPIASCRDPAAGGEGLVAFCRGVEKQDAGDIAGSVADFDRALALAPTAEAYLYRGHAHYLLGRHEAAIADLSQAIDLDPSLADAFRWRAHAEYRAQRYLSAVRDCGEYARLRPEDTEGYYCRGIMLSRAGDHDAAIADYQRAIERARTAEAAGNAWYGIGLCHERAGRTAEAVAAYRKTLEVYPEQAQARAALERLTKPK